MLKLTQRQLEEIVKNIDKGLTVQFTGLTLKQYENYCNQINLYLVKIGRTPTPFFN
tara:strand:- start:486 stop:653 length:168 start_codon:yes stop_codon:yes gene_type:complete